jgi:uncharacterized protein (TIGR02444 family)
MRGACAALLVGRRIDRAFNTLKYITLHGISKVVSRNRRRRLPPSAPAVDAGLRSLWDYSHDVYARTGVAEACLALQNGHNVDVNILLSCCWAGDAGIDLGAEAAAAAVELCGPWSAEAVGRLRAARTWMKTDNAIRMRAARSDYDELRNAIKALELEAERLQQAALASLIAGRAPVELGAAARLSCMCANVARYLETIAVRIDDDVSRRLGTLLAAASGTRAETVHASLQRNGLASRAG